MIQATKKYLRNEHTKEVLAIIAQVGLVAALLIAPPLGAVGYILKMLNQNTDYRSRARTKKTVESLLRKKLIQYKIKNGKVSIKLTREGSHYYKKLCIKSIKLPVYTKWDGLWQIVTFDIPEKYKTNRNHFAKTLNFLGFYNLEKSMYIYPFECQKDVVEVAEIFSVLKYIRYIKANYISRDKFVRHFFKI